MKGLNKLINRESKDGTWEILRHENGKLDLMYWNLNDTKPVVTIPIEPNEFADLLLFAKDLRKTIKRYAKKAKNKRKKNKTFLRP
jgi:hypothetical protein